MSSPTSPTETSGKFTATSGLEEIAPDLYVVNGFFNSFGISLPLRMTVIRLPGSSDLVVFSPLSPTLVDLSALGVVKAVIAPNLMHDTYAQAYVNAHPHAELYSSPSLPEKYPDRRWGTVLCESTPPDTISPHVLVRVLSDFHSFQEIVILHVPSRSLIVADLAFNCTAEVLKEMNVKSRFFIRATRGTGALDWSLIMKMMVRSGCTELLPQLDALLNEWDWERFIMCHGEIVEKNAKEIFREGTHMWVKQTANRGERGLWRGVVVCVVIAVLISTVLRTIN